MTRTTLEQQYREAEIGDDIEVYMKNIEIPLCGGEVWKIVEDGSREVHFGECGYYLMEHDGQIGVFR